MAFKTTGIEKIFYFITKMLSKECNIKIEESYKPGNNAIKKGSGSMEWTKDEIKALRKFFGSRSNQEVAEILGRTPKAVERKAARLNLRKSKKYMRKIGRL